MKNILVFLSEIFFSIYLNRRFFRNDLLISPVLDGSRVR